VSGQTLVQPLSSVQVIFPPFSEVSMYRVWPCPLTRTAPNPGTLLALIVTAADGDLPAAAPLEELAAVPDEDDDPQAATVAAAPRIRLPYSSRRRDGQGRWLMVMLTGKNSFSVQHEAATLSP
jgi:hypothetical protein